MDQVTYSSESQLRRPRFFLRELVVDSKILGELSRRFFITNFRSQYRQNWLGYLWLLIPPLVTTLIWFYLGRSGIINTNTSENVYPVYVLTGVFIYQTFVEAINCPLQQLTAQRYILNKIKVPHEAFVIAGLGNIAFNLLIRAVFIFIALLWFAVPLHYSLLLAPIGFLSVILFGVSLGLLIATPGMLYKDISSGLGIVISLWFFVTPIVYSLPSDANVKTYFRLNPLTSLIGTTRNWIIDGSVASDRDFWTIMFLSFILLLLGICVYRLAKPHLIARLPN